MYLFSGDRRDSAAWIRDGGKLLYKEESFIGNETAMVLRIA
jgi:hypothetical protein